MIIPLHLLNRAANPRSIWLCNVFVPDRKLFREDCFDQATCPQPVSRSGRIKPVLMVDDVRETSGADTKTVITESFVPIATCRESA